MSIKAKQSLRGSNNVGDVLKGDPGVTFTPELDEHGNLTWTNDGNLENPATINLKGPKGEPGAPGKSAYEYAQEAGYTGTEEEFAEKLASDKAGASSWNDLEDKPFGETTVKGDTLTWDGNTEGLVSVADMLYKISDNVLTIDDVQNGAIVTVSNKEATTYSADQILEFTNTYGFVCFGGVYSVPFDNFEVQGMVFPNAGIYIMAAASSAAYTESITIPGYNGFETTTIQPIEMKYLPEHLQFGETVAKGDTVDFVIDVTGKEAVSYSDMSFYCMVDAVVTPDDLVNGYTLKMAIGGQEEVLNFEANQFTKFEDSYEAICIAQEMLLCVPEDNYDALGEGQLVFPKKGIYLPGAIAENVGVTLSLTIPGYGGFESKTIKPIDEKYLPDSVKGGGTASAIPDDEMLEFLMDMNIVQPVSNTNNAVYIDGNNKLYVL